MTPRARALLAPLVVLGLVLGSHLGFYSGYYNTSRYEVTQGLYSWPRDDALLLLDGVPTQGDAEIGRGLRGVFLGQPGASASGILDMRPVPTLLHHLAASAPPGEYFGGLLLNALTLGAGTLCAFDLARRLGTSPLLAATFAALLVGGRGVGFYVGCPDALALAWLPIGLWSCERLRVCEPRAVPGGTWVLGLLLGLAMLSYLQNLSLLVYVWLRGQRRAPLTRLVLVSAIAMGVVLGWRLAGRAAGLEFHSHADEWVVRGARDMWLEVSGNVARAWVEPAPGSGLRGRVGALLTMLRWELEPPRQTLATLRNALGPAFGWPYLLLALVGLVGFARRAERWIGCVLFLPPVLMAWPLMFHWAAPRLCYPGWIGLAWLSALALVGLERRARAGLSQAGASPAVADGAARLLFCLALAGLLLGENRDRLGDSSYLVAFHFGEQP